MDSQISIHESNAIKGLAILMIIIHHFEQQSILAIDFLSIFKAFGPVGCSAFFFVSGFGLTKSKSEKDFNYWTHRIAKIYIPFVIANAIYVLYNYNSIDNILDVILFLSGVKLINEHCWFIHALLLLYVGYAIGIRFNKKYAIVLFSTIMGIVYSVITKSPGTISWLAFPMGIFFAELPKSSMAKRIVFIVCNTLLFTITCYMYHKNNYYINSFVLIFNFVFLVLSSSILFVSIRKLIVKSCLLKHLGTHSMDFYLIHGICLNIIVVHHFGNGYFNFVFYALLILILATLFGLATSSIHKIIKL